MIVLITKEKFRWNSSKCCADHTVRKKTLSRCMHASLIKFGLLKYVSIAINMQGHEKYFTMRYTFIKQKKCFPLGHSVTIVEVSFRAAATTSTPLFTLPAPPYPSCPSPTLSDFPSLYLNNHIYLLPTGMPASQTACYPILCVAIENCASQARGNVVLMIITCCKALLQVNMNCSATKKSQTDHID